MRQSLDKVFSRSSISLLIHLLMPFGDLSSALAYQKSHVLVENFDMKVMEELEKSLSFERVMGLKGSIDVTKSKLNSAEMHSTADYRFIYGVLRQDIQQIHDGIISIGSDHAHRYTLDISQSEKSGDNILGPFRRPDDPMQLLARNTVETGLLEITGETPRILDPDWLRSNIARFHLIGVVNRIDRLDIDSESPCGETRLFYRLGYSTISSFANPPATLENKSTLPFVLNVIYRNPVDDCSELTKKWHRAAIENMDPLQVAKNLVTGPLSFIEQNPNRYLQLETNFQVVRFSSAYTPDFGGQAMYLMRVFGKDHQGNVFQKPLENTIDPATLKQSKNLAATIELLSELSNNLAKIDRGTYKLPSKFDSILSKRAISFSTLGYSRLANKPFSEFFRFVDSAEFSESTKSASPEQAAKIKAALQKLKDLDQGSEDLKLKFINSRKGFIERLNNLSCTGCHQVGSTAGFHVLGYGHDKLVGDFNFNATAYSGHVTAELDRRSSFFAHAWDKHKQDYNLNDPNNPYKFRPMSLFSESSAKGIYQTIGQTTGKTTPELKAKRKEHCLPAGTNDRSDFRTKLSCEAGNKCEVFAENVGVVTNIQIENGNPALNEDRRHMVVLGECRPDDPDSIGMACFHTKVASTNQFGSNDSVDWNLFGFSDIGFSDSSSRVVLFSGPSKKYGSCGRPKGGAPLGRVQKNCSQSQMDLSDFVSIAKGAGSPLPQSICAIRGGNGIGTCSDTFNAAGCLEAISAPRAMLDTCSEEVACRPDYICQSIPIGVENLASNPPLSEQGRKSVVTALNRGDYQTAKNLLFSGVGRDQNKESRHKISVALRNQKIGFCTPNYFLFNMRIDGHPLPLVPEGHSNSPELSKVYDRYLDGLVTREQARDTKKLLYRGGYENSKEYGLYYLEQLPVIKARSIPQRK